MADEPEITSDETTESTDAATATAEKEPVKLKQAVDITVLRLEGAFAEYFMLCSGQSTPQLRAISDAIPSDDNFNWTPPPGATVKRDGAIAYYVQYGAMVDGAGLRALDVAPHNIAEVLRRHPRGPGFKRGLSNTIKEEARAVPGGRFGLLRRCGMTLAVRMAPFDS